MAELVYELDFSTTQTPELDPTSAIMQLRAYLVEEQPDGAEIMTHLRIRLVPSTVGSPIVKWRWYHTAGDSKRQAGRAREALKGDGQWLLVGGVQDDGYQPLPSGLASLLLESGPPIHITGDADVDRAAKDAALQNDPTAAKYDPEQKLLVTPFSDFEASAKLFWRLGCFVTQRRAIRAREYQLFWIMEDAERRANLGALVAGGYVPEPMDCYLCDPVGAMAGGVWLVFLPKNKIPGRQALADFGQIVALAPQLFGAPPGPGTRPIAALFAPPRGSEGNCQLLYLGGLEFLDESAFVTRDVELGAFELVSLESSAKEVAELGKAVYDARPRMGYQLELRRTPYLRTDETEILRLQKLQRQINSKLDDLRHSRGDYPILLRFSAQQLPVLGDFIRYFGARDLEQVGYGYQHLPGNGAGLHFLYLSPGVETLADLDPLSWWGRYGGSAMRFWPDPTWFRCYEGSCNAEVFVPYGLTLYPALHSFNVTDMDSYLRQAFLRQAEGQSKQLTLPERPIFLFDGEGEPDERLRLSVLDFDQMVPIRTQLEWLNHNLALLQDLGLGSFIREMASRDRRHRLADSLARSADEADRSYGEKASKIEAAWAEQVRTMLVDLTEGLRIVADRSRELLEEGRGLDQQLEKLNAVYNDMRGLARGVDLLTLQTSDLTRRLQQQYAKLVDEVAETINLATGLRGRWNAEVTATIEALETTDDALRARLGAVRNPPHRNP